MRSGRSAARSMVLLTAFSTVSLCLSDAAVAQEIYLPGATPTYNSGLYVTTPPSSSGGIAQQATQASQATQAQQATQYQAPMQRVIPPVLSIPVYQNTLVPGGLSMAAPPAAIIEAPSYGITGITTYSPQPSPLMATTTATTTNSMPAEIYTVPGVINTGPGVIVPQQILSGGAQISSPGNYVEIAPNQPSTTAVVDMQFPYVNTPVISTPPATEITTHVISDSTGNALVIPISPEVKVVAPPPPEQMTATTAGTNASANAGGNSVTVPPSEDNAGSDDNAAASSKEDEAPSEAAASAEEATAETEESAVADAADPATVENQEGEQKENKISKAQLEYEATLRAMGEMNAAKERAQSKLGYTQVEEDIATATQSKQVMGPETLAMIAQLGQMIQGGARVAIAVTPDEVIEVQIDPKIVAAAIEEEKKRRAAREKKLRKELERQRREAEREKKKAKKELDRRNRDARYRDRLEREERQRNTAKELNDEQKKLKDRGKDLADREKDMDTEDKNLRRIEDEFKKDDPNCESSSCQNVRRMRADLQKERTQLQKDQTTFQKDAQQFNNKVRDWEADGRELEDLKDRGYGMNKEERAVRADEKKLEAIKDQQAAVDRAKADLRRQAKWMEADGGISEDDADKLRSQMRALDRLDERLETARLDASADLLESEARALGLGAEYDEAAKRIKANPSYPGERPGRSDIAGYDAVKAERAQTEATSTADLQGLEKRMESVLGQLDTLEGEIGGQAVPELGDANGEALKLSRQLDEIQKQLAQTANGQKFMNDQTYKDLNKAKDKAAAEVERHERALQNLGDSTAVDTHLTNLGQGEAPTFRSEAELQRQASFSFTGPESLRDEVMRERAAIAEATSNYLSLSQQVSDYALNNPDYQKAQELRQQADGLRKQLGQVLPQAQLDLLKQDVGVFNASVHSGLPRNASGEVDAQAVADGIGGIAQVQMRMVQTAAQLDAAKQAGNTEQAQKLQSELGKVQDDLARMGVHGEFVDGRFQPVIDQEGVGIMWNAARDAVAANLEEIERNRKEAGMSDAELPKPGESGKTLDQRKLTQLQNQIDSQRDRITGAVMGGNAAPPAQSDAAQALTRARDGLEAQINGIDSILSEISDESAPAFIGLVETRKALEASYVQVDKALAEVEKKDQSSKATGKIIDKTGAVLEKQQSAIDTAEAEVDPLSDAASIVERAGAAVGGAIAQLSGGLEAVPSPNPRPQPIAIPGPSQASAQQAAATLTVPTTQAAIDALERNRAAIERAVEGIDSALAEIPDGAAAAVGYEQARRGLEAQLIGIDQAIKAAKVLPGNAPPLENPPGDASATETGSDPMAARRALLETRMAEIDERIRDIDVEMGPLPADSPKARGLARARQTYVGLHNDFLDAWRQTQPGAAPAGQAAQSEAVGSDSQVAAMPDAARTKITEQMTKLDEKIQQIDTQLDTLSEGTAKVAELERQRQAFVEQHAKARAQLEKLEDAGPQQTYGTGETSPNRVGEVSNPQKSALTEQMDSLDGQIQQIDTELASLPEGSTKTVELETKRQALVEQFADARAKVERLELDEPQQGAETDATSANHAKETQQSKTEAQRNEITEEMDRIDSDIKKVDLKLASVSEESAEGQELSAARQELALKHAGLRAQLEKLASASNDGAEAQEFVEVKSEPRLRSANTSHAPTSVGGMMHGVRDEILQLDGQIAKIAPGTPHAIALQQIRQAKVAQFRTMAQIAAAERRRIAEGYRTSGSQDALSQFMSWVEADVLGQFAASPLAESALPSTISGMVMRFGPETARKLVEAAITGLAADGLSRNGLAMVDRLLALTADQLSGENQGSAATDIHIARARILAESLASEDPALSIDAKGAAAEKLAERLNVAVTDLRKKIGQELAARPGDVILQISSLAKLTLLASLPTSQLPDVAALLNETSESLLRLQKIEKLEQPDRVLAALDMQIGTLEDAVTIWPRRLTGAQRGIIAERLAKNLANAYALRQRLLLATAGEKPADAVAQSLLETRIAEASHRIAAGEIEAGIALLDDSAKLPERLAPQRDAALASALMRIRGGLETLDPTIAEKLGGATGLDTKIVALLEKLAGGKDAMLARAAALELARRNVAAGDTESAAAILDRALSVAKEADPALTAERLKLAVMAAPEGAGAALAAIPEDLRLPVAFLAIDGLIASEQRGAASRLLEAVGNSLPAETLQQAQIQALRVMATLRLTAMGETTAETVQTLRAMIDVARNVLVADGIDETYRKNASTLLDGFSRALDTQQSLTESLAAPAMPPEGYANALRQALSLGRYDLVEKAMERQAEYLQGAESGDVKAVKASLRETAGLLELIRQRVSDPSLTGEQRDRMQGALQRMVPQLMTAIESLSAQRRATAWAGLPEDEKVRNTMLERRQQALADLRSLSQLKARTEMLLFPVEARAGELLTRMQRAGSAALAEQQRILKQFAGLGKAIANDPVQKAALESALAKLDAMRAERDGIEDIHFRYAASSNQDTDPFRVGFLPARNARDAAMRGIQNAIVGSAPGWSASEIVDQRKRLGIYSIGRGERERFLAKSGNKPADWELKPGSEAMDYWLDLAVMERNLSYLERRRGQLVWEDPDRTEDQSAKLLNLLYEHEAKMLEGLVAPSNALSELNQRLSGFGDANRAQARALRSEFLLNEEQGLIGTFESAKATGDMQAAFSALVQLRERSLAGEINAYVDYMNIEWYRAGPARAFNLWVGEAATREALESLTAEAGILHSALIRAANNPPESLGEADRKILSRHGFLTDTKYSLPEHVKIRPTNVASEFAKVTQQGVLGRIDGVLNAAKTAELIATVVVPGGLAAQFSRGAAVSVLAESFGTSALGRLAALGFRTGVEAGVFTALSRTAQTAIDPERMADLNLWTPGNLLSEFLHNYAVIGVLKLKAFGQSKALEALAKPALTSRSVDLARALIRQGDPIIEAGLLTAMHNPNAVGGRAQETFIENLAVVAMLRAVHAVPEGAKSLAGVRAASRRAETISRDPAKAGEAGPQLGQTSRSWQRFYEWMDNYHLPARRLMVRYKGSWNDARKDYQAGKLSESDMQQLVNLRKWVVDSLSAEIVAELKGTVEAFGSDNKTSDYDISFVGPNAQAAVILFNARFLSRWGAAVDIGGRETGIILDTNAYTATEHANFVGGREDVWLQDSFAHLAARKYLSDADWAAYRSRLEATNDAPRLKEMFDWAERRHRELQAEITAEVAKLESGKQPATKSELQLVEDIAKGENEIVAQNRLYESALREIANLIEQYKKTTDSAERSKLAQDIRNAQSKALYLAQEAYQTQASIDHVVTSIQAAKRKITVESLLSDELPKLNIDFPPDRARQSYVEQIANMMKELSHGGDNAKLAGKAAKYFIRALDAAHFALVDLRPYRDLVAATVEIDANRAKATELKGILKARDPEEGGAGYVNKVIEAANELMTQIHGGARRPAAGTNTEILPPFEMPPAEFKTEILPPFEVPTDITSESTSKSSSANPEDTIVLEPFIPPPATPAVEPVTKSDARMEESGDGFITKDAVRDPLAEQAVIEREMADAENRAASSIVRSEGIDWIAEDPVFARWWNAPRMDIETRSTLATIGQLRSLLTPAERAEADASLGIVERLMTANSGIGEIDLLAAAKHLNLNAGRAFDGQYDPATRDAVLRAAMAIEAARLQAPQSRISVDSLISASRLPGGLAVDAMNIANRALGLRFGVADPARGAFQTSVAAEPTTRPESVLQRLDLDHMAVLPRGNQAGDAAFYLENGLAPQLTVRAGDRVFHLSRPFLEREGKAAVIAFQETDFGTVIPRVFYLSNEHGVWRNAIAIENDSLLLKGPRAFTVNGVTSSRLETVPVGSMEVGFANESSVDIAAELQPVLGRWLSEQGAMSLPESVRERAFFGNVERVDFLQQPQEFSGVIGFEEVRLPFEQRNGGLRAELQPDLVQGPIDQWQFDHPLYGRVTGQLYMTQNRQAVYVVLRTANGDVWVPSVQMANVGISPFGTRWRSYRSDLTATPLVHGSRNYVPNTSYRNALNTAFR